MVPSFLDIPGFNGHYGEETRESTLDNAYMRGRKGGGPTTSSTSGTKKLELLDSRGGS